MKTEKKHQILSKYLKRLDEKRESGELIDLTEIYNDFGRPLYKSPKRIQNYLCNTNLKYFQTKVDDSEILVIQYMEEKVYGNYYLALLYLNSMDNNFRNSILRHLILSYLSSILRT